MLVIIFLFILIFIYLSNYKSTDFFTISSKKNILSRGLLKINNPKWILPKNDEMKINSSIV